MLGLVVAASWVDMIMRMACRCGLSGWATAKRVGLIQLVALWAVRRVLCECPWFKMNLDLCRKGASIDGSAIVQTCVYLQYFSGPSHNPPPTMLGVSEMLRLRGCLLVCTR